MKASWQRNSITRPRWIAVFLMLGTTGLVLNATAQTTATGTQHLATRRAKVNLLQLTRNTARPFSSSVTPRKTIHPVRKPSVPLQVSAPNVARPLDAAQISSLATSLTGSLSPPVASSFAALGDDNLAIPPDTMGAVGPNDLMVALNSQVIIQDRTGGVVKAAVNIDDFWSPVVSNPAVFDPHVMYDPFNDRWIFTAVANAQAPDSAVLVGVSETGDPSGNWLLNNEPADPNGFFWADYDTAGFNKNWIVVAVNLFSPSGSSFGGVAIYAFDKTDLYTNTNPNAQAKLTLLHDTSSSAFSVVPAQTYDNSLDTMYLLEDWDGSQGRLRISAITGAVGSETLTTGTVFAITTNLWDSFPSKNNAAPQLGTTHGIDLGDSRILSCQYRNGSLWAAQTVFLPFSAATRSAAQWWQVDPTSGTVQQFGRMDDPAGGRFYAYPGLGVNANNDVLIGYSRFSSWQYASGNYAFRFATDPPNTLRSDTVLKMGEGPYYNAGPDRLNRWGDFSSTVVDPVDDMTLWTIQEYAATPVGNPKQNESGRWGTWWGRVPADLSRLEVAITEPGDDVSYASNATVIVTATNLSSTAFNKIEFFADDMKIGETNAAPYTISWSHMANGNHGLTAIGTDTLGHPSTSSVISVTIGDSLSPVGTWETRLSGSDKGTAYVTLGSDFSISGYGITANAFGLFTISGRWAYSRTHQIVGEYEETIAGDVLLSGSLAGKSTSGKKVQATVSPGVGTPSLKLTGSPAATVPDLAGDWTATATIAKTNVTEHYHLSPSMLFTNVFDLLGQGATSLTGSVIVTRSGVINAATTNGVPRSLAGRVSPTAHSITLKGFDHDGNKISIKAAKQ